MKPKNAALFLVIAAAIWILIEFGILVFVYVSMKDKIDWISILFGGAYLLTVISFLLVGWSILKQNNLLKKKLGLVVMAFNIVWLCEISYFKITYFSMPGFGESAIKHLLVDNLEVLQPISAFLFGLMLFIGDAKKTRIAACWLLAGSLICCFQLFGRDLTYIIGMRLRSYDDPFSAIRWLSILGYIYHFSLIAFAVSLIRKHAVIVPEESTEKFTVDNEILDFPETVKIENEPVFVQKVPSIIEWIADFLMAMIPLFGFVFLIWRGQSKRDKYRRNWAIGSFLISLLAMLGYLLLYKGILDKLDRSGTVFLVFIFIFIALFLIWLALLTKANNDEHNNPQEEGNEIPSALTWVGWSLIAVIPIIGLICLIDWAARRDDDGPRKKWAAAMLIRLGINLMFYLFLYYAIDGAWNAIRY